MAYCYAGQRSGSWTLGPIVDAALGTLEMESREKQGVRLERHGWWGNGGSWVKRLVSEGEGN